MGDEQLIDLIRRFDCIYNNKCSEYRDVSVRNAAWDEIANLHGKSVEECKETWNKLRNCFNNAMKRRQKKCEQGKKIAPWRFEGQMSFLKPFMESRPAAGNIEATTCEEEQPTCVSSSEYEEESNEYKPQYVNVGAITPTSNVSYKRKASPTRDHNYLSKVMELMGNPPENRKVEDFDGLDLFFLSMSRTVRKLPRLDQIQIKMDLHKAVSNAEIKQL